MKRLYRLFYESLNKVGLEYLDLYLIHMPLGDYYGAWRAMEDLYEAGKIRAIGVCDFDAARLMVFAIMRKSTNGKSNRADTRIISRMEELSVMKELGIQVEGWAPFAEGLKGMFTEPYCGNR